MKEWNAPPEDRGAFLEQHHDRNTSPAVIVGGANGRPQGNRHVVTNRAPSVNLPLNIAELADVQVEKIGSATKRLDL